MLSFFSSFCVIFFVIETSTRCHSFSALPQLIIKKSSTMRALSMSSSPLNDLLGVMPLCLTATSKTTTTNDPTAGMSPDEILNYISNVGGGMCGYPDWARTAIGVGLNLSLIIFGLCTVSYVVLSGAQFALESQVEDELKAASKFSPGDGLASVQSLTAGVPQMMDSPNAPGSMMTNTDGTEMNRSQRRMKQRIASDKDKK